MKVQAVIFKNCSLKVSLFFCLLCCSAVYGQNQPGTSVEIPVAKVWSGHQVGFDIVTTDKFQYVCYYDTARNMVVAQRPLKSKEWKRTILPTKVGWDSHNYIDMVLDKNGFVHVSGNMHGVPLIYFRSEKPENIDLFEKLPMTGKNEERATYPVFFKDQKGELYFQYRNGGSGDGITYWNKYNAENRSWSALFDTPFFDGEKESNAYMSNPQLGPDGYFYIIWMWRLSPIANTNHNLSCIRSKDLLSWENMKGDKIPLPVKWSDNKAVVDPVAPWNGLINMSFHISWDKEKIPYISYHKFDKNGISQVFVSRWEKGLWQTYQISSWKDFTWDLNRGGSLRNSVSISGITDSGNNTVTARFMHEKYGSGRWVLDKKSLQVKQTLADKESGGTSTIPVPVLAKDMTLQTRTDNTGKFIMQWQTLPTFQDKPRPKPYPEPSDLVIFEMVKN